MPLGQMPVLEIDGEKIHQSVSIARYIGRRVGLAGKNDYENLKIDVAAETVNDFRLSMIFKLDFVRIYVQLFIQELAEVYTEQDETIKEKKRNVLKSHIIPFCMEKLEAIAEKNNGYLALSRVRAGIVFLTSI